MFLVFSIKKLLVKESLFSKIIDIIGATEAIPNDSSNEPKKIKNIRKKNKNFFFLSNKLKKLKKLYFINFYMNYTHNYY